MEIEGVAFKEELAEHLRRAMRGYASSVMVISAADRNGTRYAMSVTSATSLTLDPPAMLMCVNRQASCYALLNSGCEFCINVLAVDHLRIARLCTATKGEGRFAAGDWQRDECGVPYLSDAQAAIFCRHDRHISYGTHDIFIGRVRRVIASRPIDPLVYIDGAYKGLRTEALVG
jgi:flavin reductase (DIM6/NTAB) family NADH-FMN oxidoreductase RutF